MSVLAVLFGALIKGLKIRWATAQESSDAYEGCEEIETLNGF